MCRCQIEAATRSTTILIYNNFAAVAATVELSQFCWVQMFDIYVCVFVLYSASEALNMAKAYQISYSVRGGAIEGMRTNCGNNAREVA